MLSEASERRGVLTVEETTKNVAPSVKAETVASGVRETVESGFLHQVGVLQQTTYTISVDSVRITNTRSLHEDTDFATASITIGTGQPQTQTKALGNLNNGTHPIGFSFPGITVPAGQKVVLTYAIVNNGHGSPGEVQKLLTQAGTSLANKAAQAAAAAVGGAIGAELGASIGSAAVPIIGTALGALAGWLVGELTGIIFADCDGPVAAGVHVFTAQDLATAQSQSDHTPGTDSAWGCGSNSEYYVNWSTSVQTSAPVAKAP
jgi:hypothetical protein